DVAHIANRLPRPARPRPRAVSAFGCWSYRGLRGGGGAPGVPPLDSPVWGLQLTGFRICQVGANIISGAIFRRAAPGYGQRPRLVENRRLSWHSDVAGDEAAGPGYSADILAYRGGWGFAGGLAVEVSGHTGGAGGLDSAGRLAFSQT